MFDKTEYAGIYFAVVSVLYEVYVEKYSNIIINPNNESDLEGFRIWARATLSSMDEYSEVRERFVMYVMERTNFDVLDGE